MSREKSRSTAATEASTSSPCWWPWVSLTCLKSSRSTITSASGLPKRRLRSISRSRMERNARALARPASSSVTAWRSTVSCRLAFSIDTMACPARYSSSSSSSREKAWPRRAMERTPRYSGSVEDTRALIATASACASPASAANARRGPAGVHGLPHREGDDPVAVEAGREGVADAADRGLELLTLALDLLDLGLELRRHAVELVPELGELVAAAHGDRVCEVAAREAARGVEEGADLAR